MIPQGDRYFERGYWRLNKVIIWIETILRSMEQNYIKIFD